MLARGAEDTRKAGIENLALIRGDATALPFEDSSFDCVCCFAALHLFADPFDAIDEMRRVLAPGGRIAIMTSIRRPVTVRPMKPVVERLSGMRVFEPDEITEALAERGFEGHPPPRLRPRPVRRRPPGATTSGSPGRTASSTRRWYSAISSGWMK